MSLRFLLPLVLSCAAPSAWATAPVLIAGEAEAVLRNDEARTTQVIRLTEEARSNALAKAFGFHVAAAQQLEVKRDIQQQEEHITRKMESMTRTQTAGIWLADETAPEITESTAPDGSTLLEVRVYGYATEATPAVAVRASVMSCRLPSCATRIFREDDLLFLRFTAADDGFLFVVLEDPGNNVASFIPSVAAVPLPVKHGSTVRIPEDDPMNYTHNLQLTLNDTKDNVRQYIWFIYSKNAFRLPETNELPDRPPQLDSPAFHRWLLQAVSDNPDLLPQCVPISVLPRDHYD
jgi:hypothetical protein